MLFFTSTTCHLQILSRTPTIMIFTIYRKKHHTILYFTFSVYESVSLLLDQWFSLGRNGPWEGISVCVCVHLCVEEIKMCVIPLPLSAYNQISSYIWNSKVSKNVTTPLYDINLFFRHLLTTFGNRNKCEKCHKHYLQSNIVA